MVPKRWARRAVTRNTIKRQIYAISAQFEVRLPFAAHVVRLRSGFDRKQFISATSTLLKQAVRLELEQLFEHATNKP
jgi:ribonuclease P protein component